MEKPDNIMLSEHFSLYEVVEGKSLPSRAIELNWKNFHEQLDIDVWKEFCKKWMEYVRKFVNDVYVSDKGSDEIRIVMLSGWRCREWEIEAGRTGKSQHVIAAGDWEPDSRDVSDELSVTIMHEFHKSHNEIFPHGLAIKKPTRGKNYPHRIIKTGFIHIDQRPWKARWEY